MVSLKQRGFQRMCSNCVLAFRCIGKIMVFHSLLTLFVEKYLKRHVDHVTNSGGLINQLSVKAILTCGPSTGTYTLKKYIFNGFVPP